MVAYQAPSISRPDSFILARAATSTDAAPKATILAATATSVAGVASVTLATPDETSNTECIISHLHKQVHHLKREPFELEAHPTPYVFQAASSANGL